MRWCSSYESFHINKGVRSIRAFTFCFGRARTHEEIILRSKVREFKTMTTSVVRVVGDFIKCHKSHEIVTMYHLLRNLYLDWFLVG